MTITYPNGASVDALLMARGKNFVRVAVPGDHAVRTFHLVGGNWVTENGAKVQIARRHGAAEAPTDSECVCPKKLTSQLMSLLLRECEGDDLVDDMLYVLSAEGRHVRVQSRRLFGSQTGGNSASSN